MYKIYNNLAPYYLHEMFHMREVNLDNTTSNVARQANLCLRAIRHDKF